MNTTNPVAGVLTLFILPFLVAGAAVAPGCDKEGDDCECSSSDDNYCSSSDKAQQCDGCHFVPDECVCADCNACCTDGECTPHDCDGAD